jgi:mediator of RNA polymerase II transcription subunit 6
MTGIEFAVVHDQPPVWIIQKRYRRGPAPDDVNPIATYYIMGANVYQSPTIYSVIANRLVNTIQKALTSIPNKVTLIYMQLTSLFHVNSAFKETQNMMDFHPSKGYSWKTSADTTNKKASATAIAEKSPSTAKSSTTNTAIATNTTKSVLRAQETQVFRHWMDRAIESASIRVTQARQAIDTSELDTKATGASSINNIDSPSSQLRGKAN